MTKDYLTVSEAVEFTGKTEMTIRRYIKELRDNGFNDEEMVEDNSGKKKLIYLSKNGLTKRFRLTNNDSQQDHNDVSHLNERIAFLEKQLEIAHQRDKDNREIIKELSDSKKQLTGLVKELTTRRLK